MANKVTGSTDTSGALSAMAVSAKSALVVARVNGTVTETIAANKIFQISGTADAVAIFGADAIVAQKIVRILITNGVDNIKGIIVAPAATENDTSLEDALEATLQDKTIKCIIPESNNVTTIGALKDHLAVAEDNDMFRYGCIAPDATAAETQSGLITFAATVDSDRIFIPGPSTMRAGVIAEPQVSAAGLAALIMVETDDPALPMNSVGMSGFSGVSRIMLDTEKDALVNAGVTPLYNDGTTPTVYRLVTSKVTGDEAIIWQEGTTRFIADYVLERVSEMLRSKYKRTKGVVRILTSIRDDIKLELQDCEALEIIENFDESTLTVAMDPKDKYGALVDYEFDVVTPLYTITINQHLKL